MLEQELNADQLRVKLSAHEDYVQVCTELIRGLFVPRSVRTLRERADSIAQGSWKVMLANTLKRDRKGDQLNRKLYLKRVAYKQRDWFMKTLCCTCPDCS